MDDIKRRLKEIRVKENLKKWDFLSTTEDTDIVLYDFTKINPSYNDTNQFESTERFCDCFCKTFKLYFEIEVNNEVQQRQAAGIYIKMLFESYYNKIKNKYEKDAGRISTLLKDWCIYTKFLCVEIFTKFIDPCSNSTDIKNYFPLYHEMISVIDGALASFYRDQEAILWPSEPSLVLYNFWGVDFNEMRYKVEKTSSWLSSEERECVDYDLNESRLLKDINQYFTTLIKSECDDKTMEEVGYKLVKLLETLFVDYTYRIRVPNNYCLSHLLYAVERWGDVTKNLIAQIEEAFEYPIKIWYTPQSAKNLIFDCVLPPKAVEAIRRIKNISEKCSGFVSAMCGAYIEKVNGGWLEMPWSESLQAVGINYQGLYNDMKGEYIPDYISLSEFQNAFKYADFSMIHKAAKDKSGAGYILYLIRMLKGHIDNKWVQAVSESIYPPPKNSMKELGKNDNKPGIKKKEFIEILYNNIRVLQKKSK